VTISPPRRLIVGYAVLVLLLYFAVLLPGSLTSTLWGTVGGLLIEALIVWRLWYGSPVAWVIALGFAVLPILAVSLSGLSIDPATVWFLAVTLAQAAVLGTRPVFVFVWSRQPSIAAR
jgi:hypothetical protein